MALTLALACAIVFGAADYAGGVATRTNGPTFPVVWLYQVIGLATAWLIAPLFPASDIRITDLLWGAAGGLIGCIGVLFFYRALAVGTMSIVSPVTAVVAAIIPVAVGLAQGEQPSGVALVGIAIGIGSLAMFGGGDPDHSGNWVQAIGPAVLAGIGFGSFFTLIAQSHGGAGLWPLVAARTASATLLTLGALVMRRSVRVRKEARPLAIAAGSGDITANAFFLLASRKGDLAIVGVVASLYPATTLLLARFLLHERLGRLHSAALALATIAFVLISLG